MVFEIANHIKRYGIWYALHRYGFRNLWSIWVATRVIQFERRAVAEHAEHHYR